MDWQDALLTNRDEFISYLMMTASMGLRCRLPAIVQSYDRGKNKAIIKIGVKIANFDGTFQSFPLFEVNVHRYGGGNFHISTDLKNGDTGDIIFYDKDISGFLNTLQESEPPTLRSHALEDCEFYPINRAAKESRTQGLLITHDNGQIFVNVLNDKILIKNGATSLTVLSDNVTITPDFNVGGNSVFAGSVTIGGGMNVSGGNGANVNGSLTADTLNARNGATGTFNYVSVVNGIVTGGS